MGIQKVLRGGNWNDNPYEVRGAYRYQFTANDSYFNVGFRCAKGAE